MLIRLLPAALLAGGLWAQGLIYDNGPFETRPGFSNLDTTIGLGFYGFGGQHPSGSPFDNTLYDEITTGPSAYLVTDVEFYCYQTNAGAATSSIASAYIAFYDADPSTGALPMAGSPSPTVPAPITANTFSGIYRELNGDGATNRAIMRVRVAVVPGPLTLPANGTYWIGVQAGGSPAFSGPWFPPITCNNQQVTGDGIQHLGTTSTWNNPMLSGPHAQGLPFKLFGFGGPVPMGITLLANGCGNTGITVCGSPNIGGFLRTELTPSNPTGGIPIIGYDTVGSISSFCTCTTLHTFPIALWFATSDVIQVPVHPSFFGMIIAIQGAEFNGTGGCAPVPVNFTDGYGVRLGL